MSVYEILHYTTSDGHDLFVNWVTKLRDITARIAIDRRINRVCLGNFGDHNFVMMAFGSCVLMLVRATGCITPWQEKMWCCCFAVVTSARSRQTW